MYMFAIHRTPSVRDKLVTLSQGSQYDLACACCTKDDEHRRRSVENQWIYPVALPDGRKTFLFKTLVSNECVNNCRYCPLRATGNVARCTLTPEETVAVFETYHRAGVVSGLFLTSGVTGSPEAAMERLNRTARLLRQRQFKGYLHLKIIPGASAAAIEEAVRLASAVSLNIEVPDARHCRTLSANKDYLRDIVRPIELISRLTAPGTGRHRVSHTTQFVVGAATETDQELVASSWDLYKRLKLDRIYFSAYQRGAGAPDLPGEHSAYSNADLLMREHRLYQTDWLIRKYGFAAGEIPFDPNGNLSLTADPKLVWARQHPEKFPVNINRADKFELLRVPGLGPVTVGRILSLRSGGGRVRSLDQLGRAGKRLTAAQAFVRFD
jgi:predicted DNA-binding helix-hairpin-helix protein